MKRSHFTRTGVGVAAAVAGLLLAPAAPARPSASARSDAAVRAAQAELKRSLGPLGVVSVDRATGTPRVVARLGGFLTPRSSSPAPAVALRYVTAHRLAFGLGSLGSFRLVRQARGRNGVARLAWAQTYRGIPTLDSGLRAAVTRDGRLLSIGGAPLRNLRPNTTTPRIGAAQAVAQAARTRGSIALHPVTAGVRPRLVLYGGKTTRLAWHVVAVVSSRDVEAAVVDAVTNRVLSRTNLVRRDAHGSAWEYFPSDRLAGDARTQAPRLFPAAWGTSPTELSGANAHVYSDVDSNDVVDTSANCSVCGDIPPSGGGDWSYSVTAFTQALGLCSPDFPCSWDADTAFSWTTNLRQNGTQVYYYVNKFHDHLAAAPISFSEADGAFDGTDRLDAQIDDGADTGRPGLPDGSHIDNANMYTLPDGTPPRMQMYLFVGQTIAADSPTDSNGGDEADVVYHEYTHGLSSRLITDNLGFEGLDKPQAGAMGEAWSDWYAMDFLVNQGYQVDTAAPGEVALGLYVTRRPDIIRTEAMDCPVGTPPAPAGCPGSIPYGGTTAGGYTYADYGKVCYCNPDGSPTPEVHADGEIWGQTLWDLRAALGSAKAERLITDGMRLSPEEPSFLDERNAILQADAVDFGNADKDALWQVFARRGMGYDASTVNADDTAPHAGFALPPAPPPPPPPAPPPPPPPPPVLCVVPQLKGATPAAAQAALLAAHCKLGTVRRAYSRTVRKGRIISQSVAPAKQLADGSAVGVVVSRGKKPVTVTLCYRRHTVRVTRAKAKILRRHGARLGACKKR